QGGFRYIDAQTDDARLVLRVIREAVRDGGTAINYARAEALQCNRAGQVRGVVVRDQAPEAGERTAEISARVVINATGAWADDLRMQIGGRQRLRKLRGGHLVFPFERLPLPRAVSLLHPVDGRPVFAFPWEGVTIVGTTDVDHSTDQETDPFTSVDEAEYLLMATQKAFPDLNLNLEHVQSTFAGLRPV
ncbi:MAG: FAD-dependent oxidoreductase, partial [Anaerolineales bacterium]|nr:FAD-dependent oxidoreductase [Anaerolineales bacterium]